MTTGTDWSALRPTIVTATGETLLMVGTTIVLAGFFGLVLGVLLNTTRRGGILDNRPLHVVLNVAVNIIRPIPFIIFAAALGPLTLAVTGSTIGARSMIFPLTPPKCTLYHGITRFPGSECVLFGSEGSYS